MAFEPHPDLPVSLYKYTSAKTACLILENGTLQFSRPTVFNDLFDMNLNLGLTIGDEAAVVERILDQLWEGWTGKAEFQMRNALGTYLTIMRILHKVPDDPAAWRDWMRPHYAKRVADHKEIAQMLSRVLATQCAPLKILCLSDSGTIAPMWGTYAETLSGVVLQFTPKNEESFFRAVRPVVYGGPPMLLDEQQFVDWMSGRRALEDTDLFSMFVFTKDPSWSYEREWRLFYGVGDKPDDEREYLAFPAEDLAAAIFGSRIEAELRDKITGLVGERYKGCKLQRIVKPTSGSAYVIEDI